LEGFHGNLEMASGDDIFLLEKFTKKFPHQCHFLKSIKAMVQTDTMSSWTDFFHQQIRWGAKSIGYTSWFTKIIGIMVILVNISLLLLVSMAAVNPVYGNYLAVIFFSKLVIDFVLLQRTAVFLKQHLSLTVYPFIAILYPFYLVLIVLTTFVLPFNWKERTFSK
jgi:cellulose synthase/poly-beta-1,6-N-acetylglucosamine synthase-like glycosyltransferase